MLWVSPGASAQGYVQFNYDSLVRVPRQNAFWQDANLSVPWGIAFSPQGPIWISNDGSGTSTGKFLGQLADRNGNPIAIQNLWGLAFGNGGLAGRSNYLLFTAGSNGGLLQAT